MDDGLTAPDWSYRDLDGAWRSEDHIYVSVKEALNEWIGSGGSRNGSHLPFMGTGEWVETSHNANGYYRDDFRNWIESLPQSMGRSKYTVNNPRVSPFWANSVITHRGYPTWVVKKFP